MRDGDAAFLAALFAPKPNALAARLTTARQPEPEPTPDAPLDFDGGVRRDPNANRRQVAERQRQEFLDALDRALDR